MSAEPVQLPLTHGLFALIDADDHAQAAHKWYAKIGPGGTAYAARNSKRGDGTRATIRLHGALLGELPGHHIDHINGDGLDCRRANLRFVTPTENARNRYPRARKDNASSPYVGVTWKAEAQKYAARICVNGRSEHIGYFASADEANTARLAREREIWGITPRRAAAHGAAA